MLVDVKGHVALSGTVKEGCCRGEEAVEQMTSTPFLNSIYAFLRDEQRVLLAADATDRSIFFLSRPFPLPPPVFFLRIKDQNMLLRCIV